MLTTVSVHRERQGLNHMSCKMQLPAHGMTMSAHNWLDYETASIEDSQASDECKQGSTTKIHDGPHGVNLTSYHARYVVILMAI
jgi:hypothetical protein